MLISWEDLLYAESINKEQRTNVVDKHETEMNTPKVIMEKQNDKSESFYTSQSQLIQCFYDNVVTEILSRWSIKDGYCIIFNFLKHIIVVKFVELFYYIFKITSLSLSCQSNTIYLFVCNSYLYMQHRFILPRTIR